VNVISNTFLPGTHKLSKLAITSQFLEKWRQRSKKQWFWEFLWRCNKIFFKFSCWCYTKVL